MLAKTTAGWLITIATAAGCSGGLVVTRRVTSPSSPQPWYSQPADPRQRAADAEGQRQDAIQRMQQQQAFDSELAMEREQAADAADAARRQRLAESIEHQRGYDADSARLSREAQQDRRAEQRAEQLARWAYAFEVNQGALQDAETQRLLAKRGRLVAKQQSGAQQESSRLQHKRRPQSTTAARPMRADNSRPR